jgi:TetR/AcrR family acrAB operon transcriptional repressor
MRKTKEEAAITRENLLKAALVIFQRNGYSRTTLDDIACQASITRGAIYWHFGSKAELLNTLMREGYMRIIGRSLSIQAADDTPLQKLRKVLIHWLNSPEEDKDFRVILELVLLRTAPSLELASGIQEKREGNRQSIEYFVKLVQQAIVSEELRVDVNPEVVAITALGMINGLISLWLLDPDAFSLKSSSQEMVDLFIRGIMRK